MIHAISSFLDQRIAGCHNVFISRLSASPSELLVTSTNMILLSLTTEKPMTFSMRPKPMAETVGQTSPMVGETL